MDSNKIHQLELHGVDAMRALLASSTDGFSGTGRKTPINLGNVVGVQLLVWREYPWLFSKTYVLRVATGPLTNEGGKVVAAFKRELAHERPHVRVEIVETPSLAASALALKNQEVDVAVARSDDPTAAEGRSVFVLRKFFAAFLVPSQSKAESIADLEGERIGVLTSGPEIDPLARAVLDFYGVEDKRVVRHPPTSPSH